MVNKTILLVEDSEDDALLAQRALRRTGVEVDIVTVTSGKEALDFLRGEGAHRHRASASLPDVVLLDLKMPKMGGLDVLRRIRSEPRTRLLPVVVLTSSVEEKDLIDSYSLGANSYVRKPIDYTLFMDAARQITAYWLTLNEAAPPEALRS